MLGISMTRSEGVWHTLPIRDGDRSEFLKGRREIVDLLSRKRAKELV